MQVSTSFSSASLSLVSETSKATLSVPPPPAGTPAVSDRVKLSQGALQAQSASLSISGSTSGKKGADLGFTLGLDFAKASFAATSVQVESDPTGVSVTSQQTTGEASSAAFSFTMTSSAEGAAHLNDEVSRVSKEMKPAVKEFLSAAGVQGGWGQVNRMIRSVA